MSLLDNHNQNKIDIEESEQLNALTLIDEKAGLMAEDSQSVISSTPGSETEFKSVTANVIKRHEASLTSLERGTSIVLPKGTKVRCTHRNWAGEVFAHRVKEFAKPNGKTERVLQYYVDFGDNKFQWRDGDLLAVVS